MLFALLPLALDRTLLLVIGLRYVCGILPIAAAVTGVLIARASDARPRVYAALLALFAATHLAGNAIPWLALGEGRSFGDKFVFVNAPRELADKLWNTTWWYHVSGIGVPNPGTLPPLVDFLNAAVGPEEVLVTNFAWDNLVFYTDRRQGFRIRPDATAIVEAARAAGFPEYVFGLEGADWLIWRHSADPLPAGFPFEAVRAHYEAQGTVPRTRRVVPRSALGEPAGAALASLRARRSSVRTEAFRPRGSASTGRGRVPHRHARTRPSRRNPGQPRRSRPRSRTRAR